MLNHACTEQSPPKRSVRLATANAIVYRAYSRPYNGDSARVLHLFASGQYGMAPLRFFFHPVPGKPCMFALAERVPSVVRILKNYVSATYSSGCGDSDLSENVMIIDAHGEHIVGVEPLN